MNKKNVIFLVCDGLPYDITIDVDKHQSPMRFLQKLRKESIDCKKMYSQAPYTEASIMGLMYGRNPLDKGAYLYGMQEWENSVYKAFYDKGYRLYSSYFGSFTPPELMINGNYIYSANYFSPFFSKYIRGKLDYYLSIYKNNGLTEMDYCILTKVIKRHFETMLLWHSSKAEKNDWTHEFNPCIEYSFETKRKLNQWKCEVEKEYELFTNNPVHYVKKVFEKYDVHFLTNGCDVDGLPINDKIRNQRKWVADEYQPLFYQIKQLNRKYFIKNKQIPIRSMISSLKKSRKQFIEYAYRTYQACNELDLSKMISLDLPQICSSARAFVESFISWRDKLKDSESFFAYLHFDEFHRPLSFYSHDIADRELITKEMKHAKEYIDNLPKNYKGNISFDLAAQYLDSCIEECYTYLKERNILDDTILIVTADHGSSNFGGNVRFTIANNFFPEQYHIPFVARGMEKNGQLDNYTNIKDIPYSVLQCCGIGIPETFTGKSIYDENSRHTFVEYLGTGVPDLLRRPAFYLYRDDECAYVLVGKIQEGVKSIVLLEYYDLRKDPQQFLNLANKLGNDKKKECIVIWEKRIEMLKQNCLKWCTEEINFGK